MKDKTKIAVINATPKCLRDETFNLKPFKFQKEYPRWDVVASVLAIVLMAGLNAWCYFQ